METNTAPSSEAPATEATAAPEGESVASATPTSAQHSGQPVPEKLTVMGVELEKSKVPAELLDKLNGWNKAYTEKSQEAAELRKRADALDKLSAHPAFQKWYYEQINGVKKEENPEADPLELTPERQAELLSDPGKMREYFTSLAKSVSQPVQDAAQAAQYEARTLRQEQAVAQLADKYKDFDDLNNNGKIEAVVGKYAQQGVDIDLEDAYWLAKRPYMESEATLKAQQRVTEKANGTTIPPSASVAQGAKIVPGKGLPFEEKLRVALEHRLRGEEIRFGD